MDGAGVTSSSADDSTTGQRRARQEGSNDPDPSGSQPPLQSSQSSDNTKGNFECNICLDQAQDAVVSRCGHLFCWPCLHQWLEVKKSRPVCPVCKAAVSRDSVRKHLYCDMNRLVQFWVPIMIINLWLMTLLCWGCLNGAYDIFFSPVRASFGR